ncbi:hypothetical protein BJP34_27190 [Moorena producens PAL-8-15-08-1]|uniref:Uncharacterized protein n=1 Tax=Moorena producens PAL-8-15-08-1 TaxID=1458985 RepID=A0A1D8TYB1_9CYAN|nr:hypothetical protein BJP34_27190 [Moorena producens PAL-8-15-08-1]
MNRNNPDQPHQLDRSDPYQQILFAGYTEQEIAESDAARSWGGSAVLGVPPMSDCRGFPHERLHQESKL